ncbi:MAG: hypothetical protein AB7U85_09370 [Alphaproteobacteria bacterium]
MSEKSKISNIQKKSRIWAIASVCGESERLHVLHRSISELYQKDDIIIYLGNIMGFGPDVKGAINETILFKDALLNSTDADSDDIIILRGATEEMWCKLLCLHLASNPSYVLEWMLQNGIDATIKAYGGDSQKGLDLAAKGAVALSHWTRDLAENFALCDGHAAYVESLKHAAKTDDNELLFTSAGININLPLSSQNDNFWWSFSRDYQDDTPYQGIKRVIRGFASKFGEPVFSRHFATIDSGSGRGGKLAAVLFDENRKPTNLIEV